MWFILNLYLHVIYHLLFWPDVLKKRGQFGYWGNPVSFFYVVYFNDFFFLFLFKIFVSITQTVTFTYSSCTYFEGCKYWFDRYIPLARSHPGVLEEYAVGHVDCWHIRTQSGWADTITGRSRTAVTSKGRF